MPGLLGDSKAASGGRTGDSHLGLEASATKCPLPASLTCTLPLLPASPSLLCLASLLSSHLLQEECLSTLLPELPQILLPGASVSSQMKDDQNSHIMGFTPNEVMHP